MKKAPTSLSRRRFLQQACAAGAALAFSGSLVPQALAAISKRPVAQQTYLLMGTIVTLTAVTEDASRAQSAFDAAHAEIQRLVPVFNRHDAASALSTLNARGTLAAAPQELGRVLRHAGKVAGMTGDAFNPAIAPLVDLFAASRGKAASRIDAAQVEELRVLAAPGGIALAGADIRLEREGMRLTLDGIAKGFIADAASKAMATHGITDHMVNAGGDIRCSGRNAEGKPWNVGIRHPESASALLHTAAVANGALATSGAYENDYGNARHHLISHVTGKSGSSLSVTVHAPTAMEADALATGMALLPPGEAVALAKSLPGVGCLILDRQGRRFTAGDWA